MSTTLTRWEQRDLLSYTKFRLDKAEHGLVNKIIQSLVSNSEFTWGNLSLEGEALVQQKLRLRGYDLYCLDLNVFPNSSIILAKLISPRSMKLAVKETAKFVWFETVAPPLNRAKYLLAKFTYPYVSSTHGVKSTLLMLALLLWLNNLNYFLYALALAFVISNCMAIVIHEYWVHKQIEPKNRIVGFLLDYLGHLVVGDRIAWTYAHAYHHKHWKSSKDVEINTMINMGWLKYLATASPVHGNPAHAAAIANSRESTSSAMLPESRFLQQHEVTITLITHAVLMLTLGLTVYVYFVLFQIWLFHKYIVGFNELITHYNNKTAQQEYDTAYLFPICCGTAYHKSHHILSNSLIVGPGWVKYFNIQYYFIKLFYNITADVPKKYPT